MNNSLRSGLILFVFISFSHVHGQDHLEEAIHPVPVPAFSAIQLKKAKLGKLLFNDKRLSKTNLISCQSCHDINQGGDDGLMVSIGINNSKGFINAPTVINSVLNFKQFWDGRAQTLEEQIEGPLHHPLEMGSNWKEIIGKVGQDKGYVKTFLELYQTPVTAQGIKESMVAYEATLVAVNSRFDQFLLGKRDAITTEEKHGYERFKALGCISCHQGANVGGNMFQTFGIARDYFKEKGIKNKSDLGVYNVSGRPEDMHVFRVPSLRHVSQTAPYFHNGSAGTLEEAVVVMARYQLGQELSQQDVNLIVKFLRTLEGKVPELSLDEANSK